MIFPRILSSIVKSLPLTMRDGQIRNFRGSLCLRKVAPTMHRIHKSIVGNLSRRVGPKTGRIDARIPDRDSILRIEQFSSLVQRAYFSRYEGLPPLTVWRTGHF